MKADSPRWTEVTPSRWPHEKEGLDHVRDNLPDSTPYRAWSNLEFVSLDGTPYEVDLLVLGSAGLYLVELKAWAGRISGDDYDWWEAGAPGGRPIARRNPLPLTNAKAKAFKSWLEHHAKRLKQNVKIPYVQEALLLHGPAVDGGGIPLHVRKRVFGRDDVKGNHLERIVLDCLSSQSTHGAPIGSAQEKALVHLITAAGLRRAVPQLRVGEWKLDPEPVDTGWGWLDNLAEHDTFPDEHARVRRWFQPSGASVADVELVRRAAEREYRMLRGLDHPGLIKPKSFTEVEGAIAALVYDYQPDAVRLDTWVAGSGAAADLGTRLDVIRGIAEVIRYAHGHGLVHRGLSPSAVLVRKGDTAEPQVLVRDWQAAGAVDVSSTTTTHHARDLALHDQAGMSMIYTAPEVIRGIRGDRRLADVFSLGALAYLVLTGQPPADEAVVLRERLERDGGLTISALLDSPPAELELLVLCATDPRVEGRTPSVEKLLDDLDEVVDAVTRPEESRVGVDPLDADPGDLLEHDLTVVRELGQGSTSVAVLVERGDGSRAVLKAARDDTKASRLVHEAETLRGLGSSELVAGLIEGPLTVAGRTCLLVDLAGEQTLAAAISEPGRLNLDQLQRWGRDLLQMVDFLERQGVLHRDIKPANLGVRKRGSDSKPHLVLFDFSLASVPARDLDAGTAGYRDPFLGKGSRTVYDPAAELYAVSVTLHEMATGALPRWGDGRSDPALLKDEATLDRATFDSSVADAMVGFFARALARHTDNRFANPHDAAQAWAAVFTSAKLVDESDADEAAGQATLSTPLVHAGLSARARSALERYDVVTVEDLLGLNAFELPKLKGAAQATKDEIVERARAWRARLAQVGSQPLAKSVDAIISRLLPESSESEVDRVVSFCLGQPDEATGADPSVWPTPAEVVNNLDIERKIVAEAWQAQLARPETTKVLEDLRPEVMTFLGALGGSATADELGRRLLDSHGSHAAEPRRSAQAVALLRLVVDASTGEGTIAMRRTAGVVLVAGQEAADATAVDELLERTSELGRTAESLCKGDALASAVTVLERLRAVTEGSALEQLGDSRLLSLAASASGVAAVSARGELYERGMPAARAVRLAAGSFVAGSNGLKAHTIQSRVRARFPEAQPVPDRPALDKLIADAGADLIWTGDVFSPKSSSASTTGLRSSTWHGPTTADDVRRVDVILERSLDERGFLALAVAQRYALTATSKLLREYDVAEFNVTSWLMTELRQQATEMGADWSFVVGADALPETDPNRAQLDQIVRTVAEPLVDQVRGLQRLTLLTGAGVLARHRCVDLLLTLTDLTAQRDYACWLMAPQTSAGSTNLDGAAVPVGAQTQWLTIPSAWVHEPTPSAIA